LLIVADIVAANPQDEDSKEILEEIARAQRPVGVSAPVCQWSAAIATSSIHYVDHSATCALLATSCQNNWVANEFPSSQSLFNKSIIASATLPDITNESKRS